MKRGFGRNYVNSGKEKKHRGALIVLWIIIAILVIFFIFVVIKPTSNTNVAVIPVTGELLSGSGTDLSITFSDDVIQTISDVSKNKKIQAIIFEIDSPGGSAVASKEIGDAIKSLKGKLMTVAVIRETGASGAYWVASSCDYIIASPMSVTGSIGVVASYLQYSGLLERYNVTYERLVAGKYKDIGSPYKNLTNEERAILQGLVNDIYDSFVNEISTNRNISVDKVKEIANGLIYSGSQAKEAGLIDALGNKADAIKYIEAKKGIKVETRMYVRRSGYFIFSSQANLFAYWIGQGIGKSFNDKIATSQIDIKA
jgi:protease-4